MKIGILGAGTWGTALANMLAGLEYQVAVWSKFEKEAKELNNARVHPHLPGCKLDSRIVFTCDLKACCQDMDIVVFATPSIFVRETAQIAKEFLNPRSVIVTVAKGIEKDTLLTMSEIINDVLGNEFKVVALSGPTHAEEVCIGLPTTIVSSCADIKVAEYIQGVFNNNTMRVYTNADIKGVEICGALKNVIALAAGMSDGLGFGDNAKAAIITRGLAEMMALGKAMGCDVGTFAGLTGIGDIVVTATSKHSRNNNAGYLLGEGYSLEEALNKVGMVVEGVNALEAAKELSSKYNIEMPIVNFVYSIIKGERKVEEAIPALFGRKPKNELDHLK